MKHWLRFVGIYWLGLNCGLAVASAWKHDAVKWATLEGFGLACVILAGVPLLVWMAYHTRRSLRGTAS